MTCTGSADNNVCSYSNDSVQILSYECSYCWWEGGGWQGFMAAYMKRGYLEYRIVQDRVSEWEIEKLEVVKTTPCGSRLHLH